MYCIINLGSLLILIVIFPILVVFELILRSMSCECATLVNTKLKKLLYWNPTITTLKESYLIALMCALINLRAFTIENSWEIVSICLTLLIILMAVVIPSLLVVATWRNFHQLNESIILDTFGSVYDS